MINAFKTDNIYDAINSSIMEVKAYTNSDAIILYRIDNNSNMKYFISNDYDVTTVTKIIDNNKSILKNNNYRIITPNLNNIKNISFLPIVLSNTQKYILCSVNNKEKNKFIRKHSAKIYGDAFKTILEKMESIYQLKQKSEMDYLTQSGNRTSYEKEVNEIMNSTNTPFIYTLIDLFRLKYVNDNINHAAGDEYIKQVAQLLQKYFPEKQDNNIENQVYRIGGDEFVLISKRETKEEVERKLESLKKELKELNIGNKEATLGVNYGIVEKTNQETIEDLYRESDIHLYKDKSKMYKKLKIDRRR
jgi:diguanylate cyclase (GGDEF)-like protein